MLSKLASGPKQPFRKPSNVTISSATPFSHHLQAGPSSSFKDIYRTLATPSFSHSNILAISQPSKNWTTLGSRTFTTQKAAVQTETKEKLDEDEVALISNYRVSAEARKALEGRGITSFFPIQYETYDLVYDGRDIIARARTGTGKTLAFALPIAEAMKTRPRSRNPAALVLEPTRELAKQTAEEFEKIAPNLSVCTVYGGVGYQQQERELRRGVDIVVGTPGRLMDLLDKGSLVLSDVKNIVLDEADEMLKVGFQEDIEKILSAAPSKGKRQMCLFSATIPPWVKDLSKKFLENHQTVDLIGDEVVKMPDRITHIAIQCSPSTRLSSLSDVVKLYSKGGRTLVFAPTKNQANEIAQRSSIADQCAVIHGDISQNQREETLADFRSGRITVLVATDVAARGLDIQNVDLVVQCDPPNANDTYIHRAGRTGRAGKSGTAITFFSDYSVYRMKQIEDEVGIKFSRAGVPHASQVLEIAASKVLEELTSVKPEILKKFTKTSEELIGKHGAVTALSMALAKLSGADEIVDKSLFGNPGFRTVQITPAQGGMIRHTRMVEELFDKGGIYRSSLRNIKLCKDGSAIADVSIEQIPNLSKGIPSMSQGLLQVAKIQEIEELPELSEVPLYTRSSFGGDRRRGSFEDRGRRDFGERRDRSSFSDRRNSDRRDSFSDRRSSYSDRRDSFNDNRRDSFSDNRRDSFSEGRRDSFSESRRDSFNPSGARTERSSSTPPKMGNKEVGEYLDKLFGKV